MANFTHDIIVIGSGSAGLSVGLTMNKLGFKVLMVSPTDHAIGGDCLNDGCVPSKAFIHIAAKAKYAKDAQALGLRVTGNIDISKATQYVFERQSLIRSHENAAWLKDLGVDIQLGKATFVGRNSISVNAKIYSAKKIVIATGSRPQKLSVPGVENVTLYDNENIFTIPELPKRMLFVGAGPLGMEMAQTLRRLGSEVTIIDRGLQIMGKEDASMAAILQNKLEEEGIHFMLNTSLVEFTSANAASVITDEKHKCTIDFDAVFVATGRLLNVEELTLDKAGIDVKDHKIVLDAQLRTSNKQVYVCGDAAGDLQFSHAAEFHARIIINNFFSPFKKKLDNKYMGWVTFTDPQLATFGYSEKQLLKQDIGFIKLDQPFLHDDRAVTDDYQYAKLQLYISKKRLFKSQKILGGTMVAPHAGELIQELMLANAAGISIKKIFEKIYPYPVASRINQKALSQYRQKSLTANIKNLLKFIYRYFN